MLSFIAAIGKNRELGVNNGLPWSLPDDLQYFRDTTRGHSVIMGRKTYQAIGHLLPGRKNIIITRDISNKIEGAVMVSSVEKALKEVEGEAEPFLIGGGEIFKLALPYAGRMYITEVNASVPADAYFPEFDPAEWKTVKETFHPKDERHAYDFTFKIYERKS